MIGASISRWTMTYFAMALAWLLIALALMVAGTGYPAADLAAPDTLVLVHTVSIGWLSLAMCGALFQFVPVLVAKPLYSESWALPALVLLTAGLVRLLAGFLALGGRLPSSLWLLPLGAVLLVAGFGLVVVDLGLTAWLRPTGPARFVLVGLASLCCDRHLRCGVRVCACGMGGIGGGRSSGQRHPAACDSRSRRLADVDRHGRQLPTAVDVHAVSGRGRPTEPRDACRRCARHRRDGSRRHPRDRSRVRIEHRPVDRSHFRPGVRRPVRARHRRHFPRPQAAAARAQYAHGDTVLCEPGGNGLAGNCARLDRRIPPRMSAPSPSLPCSAGCRDWCSRNSTRSWLS